MHQIHANTANLTGCHVMVERNSSGQPRAAGWPGQSGARGRAAPLLLPRAVSARAAAGGAGYRSHRLRGGRARGGFSPLPVPALLRGRGAVGGARAGRLGPARQPRDGGDLSSAPSLAALPWSCLRGSEGGDPFLLAVAPRPIARGARRHRSVKQQPPLPAGETSSPSLSSPESESMLQVPAGERDRGAARGGQRAAGRRRQEERPKPGSGRRERAASRACCLLLSSQPGRWVRATTCSHLA